MNISSRLLSLCLPSNIHVDVDSIFCPLPLLAPSATLLQFLPQLEEVDVSWNELIGGCLKALTSHVQHVGGIRALRLCSCRLNADDVTALGRSLLFLF